MDSNARMDLCRYRMEKSLAFLDAAKTTMGLQLYDTAANRSYYAIFHAVRALLALEGKDFKKHSGVISCFQRDYIKTGIFEKELSYILRDAFSLRTDSDYEDFYVVSRDAVIEQVAGAERFCDEVKKYIETKTSENI